MFPFYAEPWQELDEAGHLVGTTVVWFREREFCSEVYEILMMAIPIGFVALVYLSSLGTADATRFGIGAVGLLILGLGLFYTGRRLCSARRELTFHDNGAIAVPRNRLTGRLWGARVLGDHREIAVIQIQEEEFPDGDRQTPPPNRRRRYEVWFYFTNGYSIRVIDNLVRADAHHVAVLLEQSLADIRKTASNHHPVSDGTRWSEVVVE